MFHRTYENISPVQKILIDVPKQKRLFIRDQQCIGVNELDHMTWSDTTPYHATLKNFKWKGGKLYPAFVTKSPSVLLGIKQKTWTRLSCMKVSLPGWEWWCHSHGSFRICHANIYRYNNVLKIQKIVVNISTEEQFLGAIYIFRVTLSRRKTPSTNAIEVQ